LVELAELSIANNKFPEALSFLQRAKQFNDTEYDYKPYLILKIRRLELSVEKNNTIT